jgi:ribonuclease BN (tRNA processing enzyme)
VLLHDAQYGDGEYPHHVGWGHSSIDHVLAFSRKAAVGRVVLFHHDPYHTDDELEALLADALTRFDGDPASVSLAYEGMTIELDRDGVRIPA